MNLQTPTAPPHGTVWRFAVFGAVIGVVLGVALTLLLRSMFGPPQHYVFKSVAIVGIVAGFGGFVGVLAEAFIRSRRL